MCVCVCSVNASRRQVKKTTNQIKNPSKPQTKITNIRITSDCRTVPTEAILLLRKKLVCALLLIIV